MRHVAVEFVHPVIVGKRALPAIGLAGDGASLVSQVDLVARPEDILIAVDPERARVMLWRSHAGAAASPIAFGWRPVPSGSSRRPATIRSSARSSSRTLYHVLWELVHVFFEHKDSLAGRDARGPP